MSAPLRPDHVISRREQLRRRLATARESLRLRRRTRALGASAGAVDPQSGLVPADYQNDQALTTAILPGALVGAMVALIGLGALWGWQTWSNRVSVPIDDRLPLLVSTEPTGGNDQPDGEAAGSPPSPANATSMVSDPELDSPEAQAAPIGGEQPDVVVHVSGAVERPGVVELRNGARVVDALAAAGGARTDADIDRVNLAAVVVDGERLHVPAQGEETVPVVVAPARPSTAEGAADSGTQEAPPMIDINAATAEALQALPGVGPSIANAIVQTRLTRGPFLSVDELLQVPGIGEAKLTQLEPFVVIG